MEEIVPTAPSPIAITNDWHIWNTKIVTLSEFAKQSRLSHSNSLNKAKRQTIEAFIEKGDWKIGI